MRYIREIYGAEYMRFMYTKAYSYTIPTLSAAFVSLLFVNLHGPSLLLKAAIKYFLRFFITCQLKYEYARQRIRNFRTHENADVKWLSISKTENCNFGESGSQCNFTQ